MVGPLSKQVKAPLFYSLMRTLVIVVLEPVPDLLTGLLETPKLRPTKNSS